MTRYRVSELTGALLDAAVALADHLAFEIRGTGPTAVCIVDGRIFNPSTDLARAMGIAWRDKMLIGPPLSGGYLYDSWGTKEPPDLHKDMQWWVRANSTKRNEYGPDPLIAICRAKVASHFGEFVELP